MERISSEAMLRFVERLEREDVCLHGFELRQDGEIRAEGYYAPFAKGQPHRMYSVSKSMVALALGLLLGEGRLRLTDHIVDFFPEALPAAPDPRLLRMTIEDMLRMTTCYRAPRTGRGWTGTGRQSSFAGIAPMSRGRCFTTIRPAPRFWERSASA